MLHAWELPPGFEPGPALTRYPEGWDRGQGKLRLPDGSWQEWIDDSPMRWCACRSFQAYHTGRWGKLIKGGETVSPHQIRPCDMVTHKVFVNNHVEYVLDGLAKAGGFGYKVALLPDWTPRDPWECAEEFGIVVPAHYYRKREKTALAVANRRARMDALKARTGGKSRAVALADDIARLV